MSRTNKASCTEARRTVSCAARSRERFPRASPWAPTDPSTQAKPPPVGYSESSCGSSPPTLIATSFDGTGLATRQVIVIVRQPSGVTMGSHPRVWPRSIRIRVSSLAFAFVAVLLSSSAGAQTISVGGYLDFAGTGPLQLVGDRGFTFGSVLSDFDSLSEISN